MGSSTQNKSDGSGNQGRLTGVKTDYRSDAKNDYDTEIGNNQLNNSPNTTDVAKNRLTDPHFSKFDRGVRRPINPYVPPAPVIQPLPPRVIPNVVTVKKVKPYVAPKPAGPSNGGGRNNGGGSVGRDPNRSNGVNAAQNAGVSSGRYNAKNDPAGPGNSAGGVTSGTKTGKTIS